MKTMKTIALLLATGAFIITLPANAQGNVVLVEQTINFKLKLTTLDEPDVTVNSSKMSVSCKLKTLSATVTTKDVLTTLGFSSSAKLIAQLVSVPNPPPPVEVPTLAEASSHVDIRIVVRDGTDYDVTDEVLPLLPISDPIEALTDSLYGSGVVKGTIKASLSKGLSASLQTITYANGATTLEDLQAGKYGNVGDLALNGAATTKGKVSLKADLANTSLNLATTTQVTGGAWLTDPDMSIPAIVEGSITTKGKNKIPTIKLADLIDLEELMDEMESMPK